MLLAQLQVLIDLLLLLLLDKLILLGGPGGICALQGLLRQTYRNCLLLPILRVGHGLPDLPRFLLVAPGLRYGRREPVGVNLESWRTNEFNTVSLRRLLPLVLFHIWGGIWIVVLRLYWPIPQQTIFVRNGNTLLVHVRLHFCWRWLFRIMLHQDIVVIIHLINSSHDFSGHHRILNKHMAPWRISLLALEANDVAKWLLLAYDSLDVIAFVVGGQYSGLVACLDVSLWRVSTRVDDLNVVDLIGRNGF